MATVEIRPAEGGADAAAFAGELVDTVTAAARRNGVDILGVEATDRQHTIEVSTAPG